MTVQKLISNMNGVGVETVSGGGTVGVLVLVGMTPCQSKSAEGGGDSTADVAFSIVCC